MGLIINGQRVDDSLVGAEFAGIKSYHERQAMSPAASATTNSVAMPNRTLSPAFS